MPGVRNARHPLVDTKCTLCANLLQSLAIVLPNLRFYFHEGVREACAMAFLMLISRGRSSGLLPDQMVLVTFLQL
ncbi:hypothetical protein WOLCODRAFT_163407, partial [Wolfiporia cocos MD-104 SS10]